MYTKNLRDLRKNHGAIAGGKGAALGELLHAGIPVPPGFVVTTAAFADFLQTNNLAHPTAQQVLDARMPAELSSVIQTEYKKLGTEFVAVRSSATAEDGTSHAWAGQLESYVPTDANNLLINIKKCWASLYSPRALAYRKQAGLDDAAVSIAVVVQQLIDSEHAGVAFSRHPVTGNDAQVVIESVQGLGEAAVGGHVTPDTYVIAKQTGKIVEIYKGAQGKKLIRGKIGTAEWVPVTDDIKLTPDALQKLTAHIMAIESHFGIPIDVEWAHAHNEFYIVQSRPITA
jgi:pyruvate,water dikinase